MLYKTVAHLSPAVLSCQRSTRLRLLMTMTVSMEGVFVDVGQNAVPGGSGCLGFCSVSCCSSAFCLDSLLYVSHVILMKDMIYLFTISLEEQLLLLRHLKQLVASFKTVQQVFKM